MFAMGTIKINEDKDGGDDPGGQRERKGTTIGLTWNVLRNAFLSVTQCSIGYAAVYSVITHTNSFSYSINGSLWIQFNDRSSTQP